MMVKEKFTHVWFFGLLAAVLGFFVSLGYGVLTKKSVVKVTNSSFSQHENSKYRKFRGEIILPAGGYWQIADTGSAESITELYLVPDKPIISEQMGGRLTAVIEEKQTRKGQYLLFQLTWPCTEYAKKHNNTGPSALQDLDSKRYKYLLDTLSRSPYDNVGEMEVNDPFFFLVPKVRFQFEENNKRIRGAKNKEVLAWELRPYVDDGKHWVLYTNGTCQRQPIDKELMRKYKQVIRPIIVKKKEKENKDTSNLLYSIAAVCKEKPKKPLSFTLENTYSGKILKIRWDINNAGRADPSNPIDLKSMRISAWLPYAILCPSPLLSTWLSSLDQENTKAMMPRNRRRPGESMSVFDILGGRAAVRETLQLQALNPPTAGGIDKDAGYHIDVESIEGIKVKPFPFEEMLKENTGKEKNVPLADLVPHDHFFVYMANPKDILAFLDQGCGFLHRLGTNFTGNGIDYGLDREYPERLGFNKDLLRSILESGAIEECALMFPDLFFIDGTDVTVICRLSKTGAVSSLLKVIGTGEGTTPYTQPLPGVDKKNIVSYKVKNGESVYRALWENLLIISTNKEELERVLELKISTGKGSLGRSAEFRYMLTQLPVNKSTWGYAYLSDPFIRRLISPEVKIGQLRRIRARAEMEHLTGCALLAQLDGMKSPWSTKNLAAYGYIPEHYIDSDYYFDKDHILRSGTYGRLSHMKTLSQVPVARVSEQEKRAYERYVKAYSRYWQQYFDPIALRLDETADGFLEAEIFILPLINNSIYNSLKDTLKRKEDNIALKIPRLSKNPVILLSLNLGEQAWKGIVKGGYSLLSRYIPIHPAIFEDFGPGLHLAVHDADPVIALGSGDLLGVFNTNLQGIGVESMFSMPVLLSFFTRPCTLILETQNPARTLSFLRSAVPAYRIDEQWRELQVRVHQVEDRDQWVFSFNLAGIIKLRFGVELHNEFLIIRNIPWSHDEKITVVDKTALKSASLITYPDACDLQLPGLFEAAQDRSLFEAFRGVGRLYPLVISGYAGVEDAAEKHESLFGFAPKHPGKGRFLWENFRLKSSTYGSFFKQRQPVYKRGDTKFGLLEGFSYLGVSMQFEDTGLRTKFRWYFK